MGVDKLKLLIKVSSEMAKAQKLKLVLLMLSDVAKELLHADRCSIFLHDEEHKELWTIVAHGVKEIRIPDDVGIAGHTFLTGEVVNIEDAYQDDRFNQGVDKKTGYHTKSILAIPLMNHNNEDIGVFQVINKVDGDYFKQDDLELLQHLGLYASSNIENAILYERLQKTQEEVIFRLSHATGYKDPETRNHIIRVGLYCSVLAEVLGWDREDIDIIRLAAPMHDIGKVGIPDKILKKPSGLTEEEFEMMKQHTIYGFDILSGGDSKITRMASEIALEHHEKWNGCGYPRGKKGADIALTARMTAISDVFDALTSERHYKKAWSFDKTAHLLREESGKHFDPDLVDIFLKQYDRMIAIKNEYQDE